MRKFVIVIILVTVFIIGLGIFFSGRSAQKSLGLPTIHEYYWNKTCPYCAEVQKFLDTWEEAPKLSLEKKDIDVPANASMLVKRASSCNISPTDVGVPFLFTPDGKCIVGDKPIIEYLRGLNL